jgi:hypothetical protein
VQIRMLWIICKKWPVTSESSSPGYPSLDFLQLITDH